MPNGSTQTLPAGDPTPIDVNAGASSIMRNAYQEKFSVLEVYVLGPTFGYSWENILAYADIGVAITRMHYEQRYNLTGVNRTYSTNAYKAGIYAGIGLETMVTKKLSMFVEAACIALPKHTFSSPFTRTTQSSTAVTQGLIGFKYIF